MYKSEFSHEDIRRMRFGGVCPPTHPGKLLHIGTPWVETIAGKTIQHCLIRLDDIEKDVTFAVDEKYGKYLCSERSDAYLIGLLSFAMRERCDFICEAPISSELLHQIESELIPVLVKYSPQLHAPRIEAPMAEEPIPSEGKIATGCSCGIDSLFAIKRLTDSANKHFKLDYAVVNNVGSFAAWEGESPTRYEECCDNAREFCQKYGIKLIITDSNFGEVFPQNHLQTHLYSSAFAIYMLRKLWGRYYYASSGCDLNDYFGLINHEKYDSAKYDLLAYPSLSITGLRLCIQGSAFSRFEKTQELVDYEPAQDFLSVCLYQGRGNCGCCTKCKRTLWMLDSLGKLDKFSHVMPVENYRRNYAKYMEDLYRAHLSHAVMIDESYRILRDKIPLFSKIKVRMLRRVHWMGLLFRMCREVFGKH